MKIAVIVEGSTEQMFREHLNNFLKQRLVDKTPQMDFKPQDKGLPKQEKLQRVVSNLCEQYDVVIALTDVYGTEFSDANGAKQKIQGWVGANPKFYVHIALHDFEAWLLPYWDVIKEKTGANRNAPSAQPETVNNNKPPSAHIKEMYEIGQKSGKCRSYKKVLDGSRILKGRDLLISANACPELKAFLNTILRLCDGEAIA